MQIDTESKILYVHIPRTGGSWFSYAWNSNKNNLDVNIKGDFLWNNINGRKTKCGRHGRLSGILEKIKEIRYDVVDFKILTTIRHPIDRILSSWVWFSQVKETAKKTGWKGIHDMLDEFENGVVRVNYLPQTYWLLEEKAKFDVIYKFEDLLLDARLPRKMFPLFNSRSHSKLSRRGRTRGYKHYLKPDEIDRIKILYKEDIDYLKPYYEDLK